MICSPQVVHVPQYLRHKSTLLNQQSQMSPQQFKAAVMRATLFVGRDLPRIVGQEAVDFSKESFDRGGFTDKTFEAWQPLKPQTLKRKTKKNGKVAGILIDEGTLKKSIDYDANYNEVTIHLNERTSDYGQVHNEGGQGKAWGKHPFTMPKRQFMGDSETLRNRISLKIDQRLTKIFS